MSEPRSPRRPLAAPAIFLFDPIESTLAETPEQLAEWERLMASKVGLKLEASAVVTNTDTLSGQPPNTDDVETD